MSKKLKIKYKNNRLTLKNGTTLFVSRWDLTEEQPLRVRIHDERRKTQKSTVLSLSDSKAFIRQSELDAGRAGLVIRGLNLCQCIWRLEQEHGGVFPLCGIGTSILRSMTPAETHEGQNRRTKL